MSCSRTMVFLEMLGDCPSCGQVLDQVEYDGQHCGECSWVSDDTLADTAAERDVIRERRRQQVVEGWTAAYDDRHDEGEMATAAACYAYFTSLPDVAREAATLTPLKGLDVLHMLRRMWRWHDNWWKPKDRRTDLVRAGALILAEIERLDRAAAAKSGGVT